MLDDSKLDRLLALDLVQDPSARLQARVIEASPRPRARRLGWVAATGLGLGLAASALAGVAVGFKLAPPGVANLVTARIAPDSGDAAPTAGPFDDDDV